MKTKKKPATKSPVKKTEGMPPAKMPMLPFKKGGRAKG